MYKHMAVLFCLACLLACSTQKLDTRGREVRYAKGYVAPNFSGTDQGGRPFELWRQWGKKVILNFSTTYNGRSLLLIPEFKAFYQQVNKEEVALLSVFVKQKEGTVIPFARQNVINYPVIADAYGAIGKLYGIQIRLQEDAFEQYSTTDYTEMQFPLTLFIDEEGVIRRILTTDVKAKELQEFVAE